MKTNLFNTLCSLCMGAMTLLLSLSACQKGSLGDDPSANGEAVIELNMHSVNPLTKAVGDPVTGLAEENTFYTLDIMVFDTSKDGGILEYCSHDDYQEGAVSATKRIVTNPGPKTIFVYANMPTTQLRYLTTLEGCVNRQQSYENNARGRLIMSATKSFVIPTTGEMDGSETNAEISLELVRDVSRVSVKQVVNAIEPVGQRQIKLSGIYLNNVPKIYDPRVDDPDAQEFWTWDDDERPADVVSMMSVVPGFDFPYSMISASNRTWTGTNYHLYGLTNTHSESADGINDSLTKVIIELTEGSGNNLKTYYYPIAIRGMMANCTYEIESVTISRLGSDDPQIYVKNAVTQASIVAKAWDGSSILGDFNYNFDPDNGTATF